jgi:hypothetical protein
LLGNGSLVREAAPEIHRDPMASTVYSRRSRRPAENGAAVLHMVLRFFSF